MRQIIMKYYVFFVFFSIEVIAKVISIYARCIIMHKTDSVDVSCHVSQVKIVSFIWHWTDISTFWHQKMYYTVGYGFILYRSYNQTSVAARSNWIPQKILDIISYPRPYLNVVYVWGLHVWHLLCETVYTSRLVLLVADWATSLMMNIYICI